MVKSCRFKKAHCTAEDFESYHFAHLVCHSSAVDLYPWLDAQAFSAEISEKSNTKTTKSSNFLKHGGEWMKSLDDETHFIFTKKRTHIYGCVPASHRSPRGPCSLHSCGPTRWTSSAFSKSWIKSYLEYIRNSTVQIKSSHHVNDLHSIPPFYIVKCTLKHCKNHNSDR
ncbi:uncharacterized protein V6R79_009093 [Siganus canaliculatus]